MTDHRQDYFDPDIDECIDFDLTEDDDADIEDVDTDVTPDYFLTPDAYDILEEVQRKHDREELCISIMIVVAVIIIIALVATYSIYRYIL